MSDLTEFFARAGHSAGMQIRILTGREGLRKFLRLHQNTTPQRPYLHYREVDDMMLNGHTLLGIFNYEGKLKSVGAVMFGDRSLPRDERIEDEFIRTRCAMLRYKGFSNGFYFAQGPLVKAACLVAAQSQRSLLMDGDTAYNTGTFERVEKADFQTFSAEQNPPSTVRQALTA